MLIKVIAILSLGIAGCGGFTTYPAKGKVVFKGDRPVTRGGRIEFQSASDPQVRATGWIDDTDGSFSLTTHREGKNFDGAVVGPHRVVVELHYPVAVVNLPNVYTIEPRENEFTIELPEPRRK
jgi:hypothetical protein